MLKEAAYGLMLERAGVLVITEDDRKRLQELLEENESLQKALAAVLEEAQLAMSSLMSFNFGSADQHYSAAVTQGSVRGRERAVTMLYEIAYPEKMEQ